MATSVSKRLLSVSQSKKRTVTVFYDWASPPSRAVLTVCHLLGSRPGHLPTKLAEDRIIQFKETRLSRDDQRSDQYGRVNPMLQVPAI